ncbi:nucleoside diphosphate kinase, putative [Plasmodium gallinaceum]|uniref:Nucleoside diphosphate kinase, putative n=1 Tax=Plasmodium gallinaceum TaxID=5849 RepID=A0A1J1GMP3_PLAGA|nr:nucleoside diphosphate kinase, putative [Plasmodium gallinaceum]CRG93636.1 nucleoside diphosphate kinase, putative [Plasmodium gallinaceum]
MKDERCVFIIFPDVTNNFKDEEVLEKLEKKDFIILRKKKVHLVKNEIKEIFNCTPEQYKNINEFYEYIESGLSVISLIEHIEGDTYTKLSSLVKRNSILIKDEKYFECLEYQCNLNCKNVPFYFSKNYWFFIRDLNFFFRPHENNNLERTLIILKPDVIELNHLNNIINDILNFDLLIVAIRRGILSYDRANKLYEDLYRKPYYKSLINFMTSTKGIVCLVIEGRNCIKRSKILCGPSLSISSYDDIPENCLKKKYGTSKMRNAVHIPNDNNIDKEIELFFNDEDFKCEKGILIIKKKILNSEYLFSLREYLNYYGFRILEEKIILMSENILKILPVEKKKNIEDLNDKEFIIIVISRTNCITCLEYLIGLNNVKESKMKRPNSIKSVFCKNDDDIIFIKDKKKINELIKIYFNFEKYNDIITIDNIKNFIFCKSVTNFCKPEENIKLTNVLMECFTKICKLKPDENSVILWLSKWFEQKEREIKEITKKKNEINKKDETFNLLKKKEKNSPNIKEIENKNVSEINNFDNSLKLTDDIKLQQKYKKVIIIPDVYEDLVSKEDNEKIKFKIIKHFEKLNSINLSFNELCKKEEKKNSLLGKKIEYTKKKYKHLTLDLIKRILKENLERNKIFNNYILTDFMKIIDPTYLTDENIIPCSFCLIIYREEGKSGKKEDSNVVNEKYNSFLNFLNKNDKNNNYIRNFLKKGKLLIYRYNFIEFIKNFQNELLIFYGINVNHIKNIINFLSSSYNYYYIDHLKLIKEEEKKKYLNNRNMNENSDLFFSFFVEKFNMLISKDYKKFIICNFLFSMEHINILEKRFNTNVKLFYFKCKIDKNVIDIKDKQKQLFEIVCKKKKNDSLKNKIHEFFIKNPKIKEKQLFTFNIKNKNEQIDKSVDYFFDILRVVKTKIIIICNLTMKNVDFIGLYLQFQFPNVVFCDLNFIDELDMQNNKENKIGEFIDDVFYENNYKNNDNQDKCNNKQRTNDIISKMKNFCSKINATYFVFSSFPSDLEYEDYEKLNFFFDIKLCILVIENAYFLKNLEISKVKEYPFSSIFFFLYNKGNLLIIEEDEKKENNFKLSKDLKGLGNDNVLTSCEKEKCEIKNSSKSEVAVINNSHNINNNDKVINYNTNMCNDKVNIEENTEIEFHDEMKKKILKKIEDRIKPKLICYYMPDKYNLKKFLKKIVNNKTKELFHCIFYEDVMKEFVSINERKSQNFLNKLIQDIKTNKWKMQNEIYIKYIEFILKNSSKYLFSNIILHNMPHFEYLNDNITENFSNLSEFTKVIQFIYFTKEEKMITENKRCTILNDQMIFHYNQEECNPSFKNNQMDMERGNSNVNGEHFENENKSNNHKKYVNEEIVNEEIVNKKSNVLNKNEFDAEDNEVNNEHTEKNSEGENNEEKKSEEKCERKKNEDEKGKYNKKAEDIKNILLKKYSDIEFTRIFINKNIPFNISNPFCPKIIILFIPQNEYLQFYLSSLVCFNLKNFKSINTTSLMYEEIIKEKIKNKIMYFKNHKMNGKNVNFNIDKRKLLKKIFKSLFDKIKNSDSNILLTGLPIVKKKYNNSDYFYQFNLFKSFKIHGIISLFFDDNYLETFSSNKNICEEKYNDILELIKKEFSHNHKLYSEKVINNNDLKYVLNDIKNQFSF